MRVKIKVESEVIPTLRKRGEFVVDETGSLTSVERFIYDSISEITEKESDVKAAVNPKVRTIRF